MSMRKEKTKEGLTFGTTLKMRTKKNSMKYFLHFKDEEKEKVKNKGLYTEAFIFSRGINVPSNEREV